MSRTTDAARDLLFALLALQNGLIDQRHLVAAFQAWVRDKNRSMTDHLESVGIFETEDRIAVGALVARHLKRHGGDLDKSLAAVSAGPSAVETLASLGDADVDATRARLGMDTAEGRHDPDRTAGLNVGISTSGADWFRVLSPHARGGLGAVFVALDLELHRLKAMFREPVGRYASARKLADDVERWAAHEPVSARAEPPLERPRRWARHHRTAMTATVDLLVTALIASTLAAILIGHEQARTVRERNQAIRYLRPYGPSRIRLDRSQRLEPVRPTASGHVDGAIFDIRGASVSSSEAPGTVPFAGASGGAVGEVMHWSAVSRCRKRRHP